MGTYRVRVFRDDCDWLKSLPWERSCEEWTVSGAEVIKRTRSRFAFIWPGERKVFIKRYLARRFSARWLSCVRGYKAKREARTLIRLRRRGVSAPEPLAIVSPLVPFGRKVCYVAQECLPGRDLLNLASSPDDETKPLLASTATRLGEILAQLHSVGFFHTDANLCNFFLHEETNELYVIDVDDGRFFPRLPAYHRRKNINQIIRSGREVARETEWERYFYEAYAWCSGMRFEDIVVQ